MSEDFIDKTLFLNCSLEGHQVVETTRFNSSLLINLLLIGEMFVAKKKSVRKVSKKIT